MSSKTTVFRPSTRAEATAHHVVRAQPESGVVDRVPCPHGPHRRLRQLAGYWSGVPNCDGEPDAPGLHRERGRVRDVDSAGHEDGDDSADRFGQRFRRHADPDI